MNIKCTYIIFHINISSSLYKQLGRVTLTFTDCPVQSSASILCIINMIYLTSTIMMIKSMNTECTYTILHINNCSSLYK